MNRLEHVVTSNLEVGTEERFALPAHAFEAIRRALAAAAETRQAKAELYRYLALAAAFDGKLESPGVALRMRALLAAEPEALRVVQLQLIHAEHIDETRRFRRREGRAVDLDAPVHDRNESTEGTIPLREFLDVAGGIGVPRVRRVR